MGKAQKSNQKTGAWGEDRAASYLKRSGYKIKERNFRCRAGEIDIIAIAPRKEWDGKDEVLCFVEVKTRTGDKYGYPEEAVTSRKQASIMRVAETYLLGLKDNGGDETAVRFDVIAVDARNMESGSARWPGKLIAAVQQKLTGQMPEIRHIRNAFDSSG